jgi:hypothetical protein
MVAAVLRRTHFSLSRERNLDGGCAYLRTPPPDLPGEQQWERFLTARVSQATAASSQNQAFHVVMWSLAILFGFSD